MPGLHGPGQCSCVLATSPPEVHDLLPFINLNGVSALNERILNSVITLFRPFEERLIDVSGCSSDSCDHELMVHIPFITPCKITSIRCIGGENGTSPKHVKLYINNDTLDFLTVNFCKTLYDAYRVHDSQPAQCLDLVEDYCGVIEYPLKATKFSNVTHLTLYFSETYGAEVTHLFFIGLTGKGTNYKRAPVTTVYEARANLSDHQLKQDTVAPSLGH